MKNGLNLANFCAQALIAACALTAVSSAEADWKKSISHTAGGAGKSAGDTFNKGVGETKKVVDGAGDLAASSANLSKNEMNGLYAQAGKAYAATAGRVKDGYNRSVAALKALYNAALVELFKAAGKAALSRDQNQYTGMVRKFRSLDADGKAALNRVTRAIAAQKIDRQVSTDMQLLATKLGLYAGQAGANIPGNVKRSSFGIQMTSSSAFGVGVEQTFGIVMNTFKEGDSFKVGLTQSLGLSSGYQAGESASIALFWAPGPMEESDGISVGMNFELVGEYGGGVGLSWGVEKGMAGAEKAIPGFAAGLGYGGEVKVGTLAAGYTKLLKTFR